MTLRAMLLVVVSIGWWRMPRVVPALRESATRAVFVVLCATLGLALVATPIIDGLDVDAETFRIAAGLVLIVSGAFRMFGVGASVEDGEHSVAWLVPVAYPVLIGPETVLAVISVAADHGVWLVGLSSLIGAVLSLGATRIAFNSAAAKVFVRTGGAVTMLLAVALVFDGLRDV